MRFHPGGNGGGPVTRYDFYDIKNFSMELVPFSKYIQSNCLWQGIDVTDTAWSKHSVTTVDIDNDNPDAAVLIWAAPQANEANKKIKFNVTLTNYENNTDIDGAPILNSVALEFNLAATAWIASFGYIDISGMGPFKTRWRGRLYRVNATNPADNPTARPIIAGYELYYKKKPDLIQGD